MSEVNEDVKVEETKTEQEEAVVEGKGNEIKENVRSADNLLESLGVDEETLKTIVNNHKENEEKNKTEIQKKDDAIGNITKELASERKARIEAEAKVLALSMGADVELLEDLVTIASTKVTKDKDINAVMAEIKGSTRGKIYFPVKDEKEEKKTVTRKTVKEVRTEEDDKGQHKGTLAERLFSDRKEEKSHFFKK